MNVDTAQGGVISACNTVFGKLKEKYFFDSSKRLARGIELWPKYLNLINNSLTASRALESPESLLQLDESAALSSLREIEKSLLPQNRRNIVNETYLVGEGKNSAYLKVSSERGGIDEYGRFHGNRSVPRNEVLAFLFDRILGLEVAPPAIIHSQNEALVLKIPGSEASWKQTSSDAYNIYQVTQVKVLDLFMGNPDRAFPGNFLENHSKEKANKKFIAIDFDLSKPALPIFFDNVVRYFQVEIRVQEDGKTEVVYFPPLFRKNFKQEINSISRENLIERATNLGLILTEAEIRHFFEAVKIFNLVEKYYLELYGDDSKYISTKK